MSVQRFSTADVPEAVRREVAEAAYGHHVRGSIDFVPDQPFDARLARLPIADIGVARVDVSPVSFYSPPDERGMVYLGFILSGGGGLGRQQDMHAAAEGEVWAMRRERDYLAQCDRTSSFLDIAIPYERIIPRLHDADWMTRKLSMDLPAARLLRSYAQTLIERGEEPISPAEQALFSSHIADLAALLLGPTRDSEEIARQGGARVARRQAIVADVRANLGNPELSIERIARRHGISASYVRSLFYDEGTTFTDFVTGARLDRVAEQLRDPSVAGHTIAALALAAGFGDISWFNQLFRRRFGMTPSDMRAGAATGPASPKP